MADAVQPATTTQANARTAQAADEGLVGPEAVVLVLLGIAIALVVPYFLRRTRRQTAPPHAPVRDQWAEHRRAAQARKSADRILVELVETGREISARMDTKIRVLNTLIRDAQRCIARLEALQGRSGEQPPSPQQDRDEEQRSGPPPPSSEGPQSQPGAPAEPEPASPPQPQDARPEAPSSPQREEGWQEQTARRVMALTRQGYPVADIARQTGLSRQEVTLVQQLHANDPPA